MTERPTYSALRRRLAQAEWHLWRLRYERLAACRAAGIIEVDDFIVELSDLGFAWDDISHELRATQLTPEARI